MKISPVTNTHTKHDVQQEICSARLSHTKIFSHFISLRREKT